MTFISTSFVVLLAGIKGIILLNDAVNILYTQFVLRGNNSQKYVQYGFVTFAGSQQVDLKRSFKVKQYTSVVDGDDTLVGKRLVNLIVWGDFNKTTDNAAVSSFVHDKVTFAQNQPQEMLLDLETDLDRLPLQVNLTAKEVVQVGPRPQKNIALWLSVQIYGHKKCHVDVVDRLSIMVPDFN